MMLLKAELPPEKEGQCESYVEHLTVIFLTIGNTSTHNYEEHEPAADIFEGLDDLVSLDVLVMRTRLVKPDPLKSGDLFFFVQETSGQRRVGEVNEDEDAVGDCECSKDKIPGMRV